MEEQFADTSWSAEDIRQRFENVSQEEAERFLRQHEEKIAEAMIEAGWRVIDDAARERGWFEIGGIEIEEDDLTSA